MTPATSPLRHSLHDRFLPPTPQQRDAIRILNPSQTPSKDQIVFDWLENTRSVLKELEQRAGLPCPTKEELIALVTLSSSDNDDVREWFRQDRSAGERTTWIYSRLPLTTTLREPK